MGREGEGGEIKRGAGFIEWGETHQGVVMYPGSDPTLQAFLDFGVPGVVLLVGLWCLYVACRQPGYPACPKCRYNMKGTQNLTCPECGHSAKSQRQLTRWKFRKRWLVLSLVMMAMPVALAVDCGLDYLRVRKEGRHAERIRVFKNAGVYFREVSSDEVLPPVWVVDAVQTLERWVSPGSYSVAPVWLMWVRYYSCPSAVYGAYWKREVIREVSILEATPEKLKVVGEMKWMTKLGVNIGEHDAGIVAEDLRPISRMRWLYELSLDMPAGLFSDELLADKPMITKVEISLRGASRRGRDDDALVIRLRESSENLDHLRLSESTLTDRGLVEAAKWRGLKTLIVKECRTDGSGMEALAKGTLLERLFASLDVTPRSLAAIGGMTQLNELALEDNSGKLDVPGMFMPLQNLRQLRLLHLDMELALDEQTEFLQSLGQLGQLRLRLGSGCDGTKLNKSLWGKTLLKHVQLEVGKGFEAENLEFVKTLSGIQYLEVDCAGEVSPRFLAYVPGGPQTRVLVALRNVPAKDLDQLRHARVNRLGFNRQSGLTDADVRSIVANGKVVDLRIESEQITDACCEDLARMPGLRRLTISNITVQGARVLGASKSLEQIHILGGKIPQGQREELKKAYPRISVQ
jgi:hypothetical protein